MRRTLGSGLDGGQSMAIQPFSWDGLDAFKRDPRFIAH
jgi:hypothetical protein